MLRVDPTLDVVVVPEGTCPQCGDRKRGPAKYGGLCVSCRRILRDSTLDSQSQSEAARRELARRELCRRRFLPFVQRMVPNYMVGWFHQDLAARLERFSNRVAAEESPRLIINVPPRRGKSEQASKGLPAWHLGKHQDHRVISATHSDRLAMDNSRDVLRYIKDPKYQTVFPGVVLDRDNQGAMGWRTERGGVYKPVGVGAGIAGYGAHVLIIDDPHRDKDAYSMTVRDTIWKWYKSSARTRLLPGGGIILIQTRWVVDDLTGRVIEEEGLVEEGGRWEQVLYPEQAEHDEYRMPTGRIIDWAHPRAKKLRSKGEYLHPERYGEEAAAEAKQDPVVWGALYQQNPTGEGATLFTEEMFEKSACKLADIPTALTFYTAWDTAQELKQRNDWSVGITGGIDADGVLWIVDRFRDRVEADALIDALIAAYRKHHPDLIGIEKTQYVVGLQSSIDRTLADERISDFPYELLDHGNKDKAQRARPIQSWMRRGKVRIPTDAPWYAECKKELKEFPGGKHDDQVDAFSYLGQMLNDMAEPFTGGSKKPKKSWRDKLAAGKHTGSWRVA